MTVSSFAIDSLVYIFLTVASVDFDVAGNIDSLFQSFHCTQSSIHFSLSECTLVDKCTSSCNSTVIISCYGETYTS